ncbi:Conserved_hypothetical protein [Hexamita inflata]|uniref:Uncharacterized protein n=1 Tax=Hexamita inflata TaxID=28002 RepID=A0AA86TYF7_9EUKA|nr:Conserved hypothetical protein [Hexamita inflata]CAI9951703.1 Conserved hypothetical protein [Hexamita inflata]
MLQLVKAKIVKNLMLIQFQKLQYFSFDYKYLFQQNRKDTYEPTNTIKPGSVLKISFGFLGAVVALHVVSFVIRPKK